MEPTVVSAAARELGRSLRFIRQARSLTLRDVARGSGLSAQYVAQVELAQRTNVSEEAIRRMAGPLGVGESVVADLLLRARVKADLEARGLTEDQVSFIWRGVEQRLSEIDVKVQTDMAVLINDLWATAPVLRAKVEKT